MEEIRYRRVRIRRGAAVLLVPEPSFELATRARRPRSARDGVLEPGGTNAQPSPLAAGEQAARG